jgi:hypothetical protein
VRRVGVRDQVGLVREAHHVGLGGSVCSGRDCDAVLASGPWTILELSVAESNGPNNVAEGFAEEMSFARLQGSADRLESTPPMQVGSHDRIVSSEAVSRAYLTRQVVSTRPALTECT